MGNSGWVNDEVTTLVIPTGATTGARVVIDGTTGDIDIYDSSNTLVIRLNDVGALVGDIVGDNYVELAPNASPANFPAVLFQLPQDSDGNTFTKGYIRAAEFGSPGDNPEISIQSPRNATQVLGDCAQVRVICRSPFTGAPSSVDLRGDQVQILPTPGNSNPPDMLYNSVTSLPRGFAAVGAFTTSSSAVGGETVVLTTGTMTFVDGRAYRATVGGSLLGSVASNHGVFRVRKTNVAGTLLLDFNRWPTLPTASLVNQIAIVGFISNTTGADITVPLALTLLANTGTVTHVASATNPRYLLIEDCGAATDFAFIAAPIT